MTMPPGSLLRALGPSFLVAVAVALLSVSPQAAPTAAFIRAYPDLSFGAVLLLAAVFRSSRIGAATLAIACSTRALLYMAAPPPTADLVAYGVNAVGVLLPANVAAAAAVREKPILSGAGTMRLGLVAGQAGFAALAWLAWWPWPIAAVQRRLVAALPETWLGLHQPALAAFLAAAAVVTVQLLRKRTPFEGAALVSLGLSLAALASGGDGDGQVLFMAGAGAAQLVALLQGAAASAVTDPLTGLPSRRALDERLAELGGPFVVALVDIDHFKKVNDVHGHPVGDQVLRMVAARLREVGGGGTAYRYGGEEFAVLFPGKTPAAVEPHLEALRRSVAAAPFALRGADRPRRKPGRPSPATARTETFTVTVSIGAARSRPGSAAGAVVAAADRALYRAKASGRNTVAWAREPE